MTNLRPSSFSNEAWNQYKTKPRYIFSKVLIFSILLFLLGCQSEEEKRIAKLTQQHPISFFEDTSTQFPFIDRIHAIPHFLRTKWQILDERKDYTPYKPSYEDIDAVLENIDLLPKHLQDLMLDKVVAIYFVDNFMGSGLTDWIPMPDGSKRYFILLNSSVLGKTMSEGLSAKERTAFHDHESISIEFNATHDYAYLVYILTHEMYHVLDYEKNCTPFVDKSVRENEEVPDFTDFTHEIWKDYDVPVEKFDFTNRKNISFYGLGKKTDASLAQQIYEELQGTPFPSLYAALSWAEDFAEVMTFYYLNEKLDINFEIVLRENESVIAKYQPLHNNFKSRLIPVESIYTDQQDSLN